jgi:hypothetical protein
VRIELLKRHATAFGQMDIGDRIDVPDDQAIRMIEAGEAVAVRTVEPERAVRKKKAERA